MSVAPPRPIFVSLVGELDMASAPYLGAIVKSLVDEEARHVVLDAQEVGFCDAAGLRALLVAQRGFDRLGSLFAIVPSRSIQRLTALLELDENLYLDPTLPAALVDDERETAGNRGGTVIGEPGLRWRPRHELTAELDDAAPWANMI
jgi:anti-anti-sigma factor